MRSVTKIVIECSIEQAAAISDALEAFARLGMGQIGYLAEMVAFGVIPLGGRYQSNGVLLDRAIASPDATDVVRGLCNQIKSEMGYAVGGSNGVGHPHVSTSVHRVWEVRKVIEQTLAEHRNPNPTLRGVNYDGLTLRYTTDPKPVATVVAD